MVNEHSKSPEIKAADPPMPQLRDQVIADDRASVRKIVSATGYFRPDEIDVAVELVDERLTKGAASGYEFLFSEADGVVVGYVCYGEIPCTLGSFDLYWIAVDPKSQRRGLGQHLIGETERRILDRGGRHVYIETSGSSQYESTRAFYRRCGYGIAAELADFYDIDDDKVIWRKVLPARKASGGTAVTHR